jgi:hypothetical protein
MIEDCDRIEGQVLAFACCESCSNLPWEGSRWVSSVQVHFQLLSHLPFSKTCQSDAEPQTRAAVSINAPIPQLENAQSSKRPLGEVRNMQGLNACHNRPIFLLKEGPRGFDQQCVLMRQPNGHQSDVFVLWMIWDICSQSVQGPSVRIDRLFLDIVDRADEAL